MDSINQLLYDINNKCSDYFFGIHSISLSNYREYVLDMNGENFNVPYITSDDLTEDDLYNNMVKWGLNIPYGAARRTIRSIGIGRNVKHEDLMLGYFEAESFSGRANVIVSIPPYIELNNKKYFCGCLDDDTLLSVVFLNKVLPKEYIYGYLKVVYVSLDDRTFYSFIPNSTHFSLLSLEQRKEFFGRCIQDLNIDINLLEMVNNERIDRNYGEVAYDFYDDKPLIQILGNTIKQKRINDNRELFEMVDGAIKDLDWGDKHDTLGPSFQKLLKYRNGQK